jgi:hypothetical protein
MKDKESEQGRWTLRGFGTEARNLLAVSLIISIAGALAVVVGVNAYRHNDAQTHRPS